MHTNTISSMCSKSLQIEGINVQRQLLIELRISFHHNDTVEIFAKYHKRIGIAHTFKQAGVAAEEAAEVLI